jgi:hypothetical protein
MQAPSFEAFNSSDVNLDGFDFNLEGETDDLMLADSKTTTASAMDFQFESMTEELTSSLNDLKFDDDGDDDEPVRRPPSDARASRARRSLLSKSKNLILTNAIDFDPPANNRMHADDASINSYATAQMTHQVSNGLPSSGSLSSLHQAAVFTPDNYNEALKHLAQTMKRTEESRRQVMLQRALITQQEEERRQAEEQALQHAQQAMALRRASAMRSNQFIPAFGENSLSNGGNSNLSGAAAFLTGSSGTLTSGLAQSRRQLQMYMAQMNGQTF